MAFVWVVLGGMLALERYGYEKITRVLLCLCEYAISICLYVSAPNENTRILGFIDPKSPLNAPKISNLFYYVTFDNSMYFFLETGKHFYIPHRPAGDGLDRRSAREEKVRSFPLVLVVQFFYPIITVTIDLAEYHKFVTWHKDAFISKPNFFLIDCPEGGTRRGSLGSFSLAFSKPGPLMNLHEAVVSSKFNQ